MALITGKEALRQALYEMYIDVGSERSVHVFAKKKARAIHDFCLTGVPQTIITFPGPATGTGIGGFDSPAPGIGLAAAKPILEQQYVVIWTHNNGVRPPMVQADLEATAIFSYFSQAAIQTIDIGPLNPISMSGVSTGTGGTLTPIMGTGYESARPILEQELVRIWLQVKNERSVAQFAREMAQAIHNFCIEGKILTNGVISGGTGASVSSSIS